MKYLSESGLAELVSDEIENDEAARATQAFVDELRDRIDFVKESDRLFNEYAKKEKRKKRARNADSDLTGFFTR